MSDLSAFAVFETLIQNPKYYNVDPKVMFYNIKAELCEDPELFVSLYRLSPNQFDNLLQRIKPHLRIERRNPGLYLSITLRYLSSTDDIDKYSVLFGVRPIRRIAIVSEVCHAISLALKPLVYTALDNGFMERNAVSFEKYWNFPNCVGVIDERVIIYQTGRGRESQQCVIQLTTICNAYSQFAEFYFDADTISQLLRKKEFEESRFLKSTYLRLVEGAPVKFSPKMKCRIPFVFAGGPNGYLKKTIMEPFVGKIEDKRKTIYNYRHARAMNAADTAFGILLNRWEILQQPLVGSMDEVLNYMSSLLLLHNWLIKQEIVFPTLWKVYMPRCLLHDGHTEGIYVEECWGKHSTSAGLQRLGPSTNPPHMTYSGTKTRQQFVEYFMDEGRDVASENEDVKEPEMPRTAKKGLRRRSRSTTR